MATSVSERVSERTLESLGSGGMALLPWTKHLLTVLWEQLRLLVQVIYYTFMSVFQMFRFEVHVRITDETGEHIQHMSTAASPSESFLFSSNFCADVGDPFSGKSTAEALLSSLRADDLCCGLVDDFVTRTSGKEDGIFLGHQSSWQMGFPGDWNIFVSSSEGSGSSDGCQQSPDRAPEPGLPRRKAFRPDAPEEERSSLWSECSEEEQSVAEFDSEENRALWESLSRSSDPYNPFFFSACVSTAADMGRSKGETPESGRAERPAVDVAGPPVLDMLVCRSDSESSWSSWASSEGSSPDVDREESQRLWDLFSSPEDPYNPLCFTASTVSCTRPPQTAGLQQAPLPAAPPKLCSEAEESWSGPPPPEDEEELLWTSLCRKNDPYHPLNFQACLQSPSATGAPPHAPPAKTQDAHAPPAKTQDAHTPPAKTQDAHTRPAKTQDTHAPPAKTQDAHTRPAKTQDAHAPPAKTQDAHAPPAKAQDAHAPPAKTQDAHTPPAKTQDAHAPPAKAQKQRKACRNSWGARPVLAERQLKQHSPPDMTLVPWKRAQQPPPEEDNRTSSTQKQVRFSPQVKVHVMRTWPFARRASRRGPWEELARDRERFRRRVAEAERVIGPCLSPAHREGVRARLDGASAR